VFARIDEDGNGTISAGELAKVLRRFDPDALDEELAAKVKAILGDVDVDLNDDIGKHGQRRRQR
jgi:Ca2+-binding EF-hand superfamily protein